MIEHYRFQQPDSRTKTRESPQSEEACPKDPCTCIVYTWALKGFLYSSFRAQVYTIQVHGSFGLPPDPSPLLVRAGVAWSWRQRDLFCRNSRRAACVPDTLALALVAPRSLPTAPHHHRPPVNYVHEYGISQATQCFARTTVRCASYSDLFCSRQWVMKHSI